MSQYHKAFNIKNQNEEQDNSKTDDYQIKIKLRKVPPFHSYSDDAFPKYFISDAPLQTDPEPSPQTQAKPNNEEIQELLSEKRVNDFKKAIPLPTNRKTRDQSMTPFRSASLPDRLAQIHQPEELRTRWIFIFGICSIPFFILIIYYVIFGFGKFFYSSIIMSTLCYIIAFIGYKAQERRKKRRNSPFPQYDSYNTDFQTNLEQNDSPSEMFAKPPKVIEKDTMFNTSSNTSRHYSISDRATASVSKDQHGETLDYDQSHTESLKRLGISPVTFNRYLNNLKSFIPKRILSKLVKDMHKDDPQIVSMLTLPGYERYSAYIKSRIISLSKSHVLAGHYGDKGARWNEKEWTTDFPSDNQIVLHILDVFFSYFMSGKKAGSSNSMFSQKFVYIKKDPGDKNEEDAIYLCSDDWAHFYVRTMIKRGKGLEEFYAPSGRDAMYAGLTLFFWFVKEKKKFLIEGCDLTDNPLYMDKVFSLNRLE